MARNLTVFARAPIRGKVKTRLAEQIGDDCALETYQQLLEHTLVQAKSFDTTVIIDGEWHPKSSWLQGFPAKSQVDGDLGARMLACFTPNESRVLIGCDCPRVSESYLSRAFVELSDSDLVLGPVEDGGYFLIGMHKPQSELMTAMSWGNARVTTETLKRAKASGLSCSILPTLWDVDDLADYQRFKQLDK